jgi:alcohol dehydrogenase (cytochrome c)
LAAKAAATTIQSSSATAAIENKMVDEARYGRHHDNRRVFVITTIASTREARMKRLDTARNSTAPGAIVAALACSLLASTAPAAAADVTYERLLNPEPQNWLMHHRDFNAQRYSPLDAINKSNARNLKLQFAVALGGKSAADSLEATPLVEDGFMYMVDSWGVVYKIDVRSGTAGTIMWKMDPELANQDRNRGAALWGNLVISVGGYSGRVIATDKETGKIVWDKNLHDQADLELTAAPLALRDSIVIGGSGGDRGLRNWLAALDPKTGEMKWKTYSIPAPGEPGSETWKDNHNSWQTGGGAFFGTGAYDPSTNLTYWGSGNPVPAYDSSYRPGDNLYTNSAIAFDAANGKITWHFQYTPNDNHDYDEIGSHILLDTRVNGEDRKVIAHPARNGFSYVLDRLNGQFLKAAQTVKDLTWTKGIDVKTGRPVDYDPSRDVQFYAEGAQSVADKNTHRICPSATGGSNFWPSSYSRKTGYLYILAAEGCGQVSVDTSAHIKGRFGGGGGGGDERITSSFTILDPGSGEIKKRVDLPYPNSSGVLSTAGGIVVTGLLDGSIIAFDDQTLDVLWRINVGSGLNAPPVTYSVNGKQYIAIASGACCVRPSGQISNSKARIARTPELRDTSQATVLYVFGL